MAALALLALSAALPPDAVLRAAEPNQLTPEQIADGWISLFDGETLFGWQATSDANWKVEDGAITVSEGEQGFLATTAEFADYELHVEFKAPPTTNSGVFVRTPLNPTDPTKDCAEINIAPMDNPFPTASLVGRRRVDINGLRTDEWPLFLRINGRNEMAASAEVLPKPWDGQWHAFDVHARATILDVQLDGIGFPSGSVHDYLSRPGDPKRGHIALQFHEGPVAFRNIRLKPLGLKPMLNGKDLAGWNTNNVEVAKFEVAAPQAETSGSLPLEGATSTVAGGDRAQAVDRAKHQAGEGGEPGTRANHPSLTLPVEGRGPESPDVARAELHVTSGRGILETDASYGDFVMQLDAFVDGDGLNSGVFFRSIPREYANGYESQIHNGFKDGDPTRPTDFGTGAIYRRIAARRVVAKDHEWFTKTIVATGPHIAVWVNGYQVTDWTDERAPDDNPRSGLRLAPGTISLQAHDPTTNIRFRNLRIAELPEGD